MTDTEFTLTLDEIEVGGCIITADLRLILSGLDSYHPVNLESVRTLADGGVPTFVWDAVAAWCDERQPYLQMMLAEAMEDVAA